MATKWPSFCTLLLLLLLFLSLKFAVPFSSSSAEEDLEALLSELENEKPEEEDSVMHHNPNSSAAAEAEQEAEHFEQAEAPSFVLDDPDVVVLTENNFSAFIKQNAIAMVEFYAPWCGHCQALAPEFAAAATELKRHSHAVPLAKIDASSHQELAEKYDVDGFPTLLFFVDGVARPYNSHRTKDAIVSWINKKVGPAVVEVTTVSDAETILDTGNTIAVAYFDRFEAPEAQEYASAARQEDDVLFYQTKNKEVARIFNIQTDTQAPALVLLKNFPERISHFDGKLERDAISHFIIAHKLPLITSFSRDTAALIFESPIKKQILLFIFSEDHIKLLPTFEAAAKLFIGKIIFVHVDPNDKDVGKPILEFFGVSGEKTMIIGFTIVDGQPHKFLFDGEITIDKIKDFGEKFFADELRQFYKSEPIPEKNDGDVKVVVGKNFEDIVLNESKDVLLEVYAPWCGHCKALEPTYNKLGKLLHGIDSLVIAKMDGTTNEHLRAMVDSFPTLLFFPAGNKSSDPITVDADRTLRGLYKFLQENAAIPFTLPKAKKTEGQNQPNVDVTFNPVSQYKDEL